MSAQPQTFAHSSEPLNPRRDLLRRCAVFAGLPDVALSEVALASQPTRLERKRARTGMLRGLFVVGAGRARLARTVGTRVVTLHYADGGGYFVVISFPDGLTCVTIRHGPVDGAP